MAITDAQQAKQIMMKKGGPVHRHQLAKKRKDGKRPGYYGPDAGHAGEMGGKGFGADTYSGGPSNIDMGGGPGGSDQDFARARAAIDARAAAAREKARLEAIEKERIKKEVEKINKNIEAKAKQKQKLRDFATADGFGIIEDEEDEQDLMDTDVGETGKTLSDLKTFDKNKDGKLGPLETLDRIRTDLARKTLTNSVAQKLGMMPKTFVPSFFMSDMMRKTPPGVTTKGLDEILGVEGRDKKTGIGSMTDPFEVDYSMTQYGLGGKDLTRARDQLDVAMQDRISQDDFDRVYGNQPPPRDDGPEPVLPIIPTQQPKDDKDEEEEEPFKLALAFRKDGGRVPYEDGGYTGGIMDLETGRQMYFLGKLVKKATRAVKKIVKSPIGKIGLGALAFKFGAPLLQGSSFMKKFGFDAIKKKIGEASFGKLAGLSVGGGLLAGALAGKGYEDEDGDGFDDKTGFSVEEYRKRGAQGNVPIAFRAEGGMSDVENDPQYKGWKRIYEVNPEAAEMHPKHKEFVKYYANLDRDEKSRGWTHGPKRYGDGL